MKTPTFLFKENHDFRLWCEIKAQIAVGKISCSWLDRYPLNLRIPEPNAWPFDMVFEFGYQEERTKIEQLCVGFIFGLEAREMAFCTPPRNTKAGLAFNFIMGIIHYDHPGLCPLVPFFLLYLVHYEYGITLKMIHIDIPLSGLITSMLLARNVSSLWQ